MITKILFTIAIIGAVIFFSRYTAGRRPAGRHGRQSRLPVPGKSAVPLRLAAYTVVGVAVAASALWIVQEWRSAHEILRVRVVNSSTGSVSEYEAFRSDIEGRSFRTVDGRRVTLAEVERLEVGGEQAGRDH